MTFTTTESDGKVLRRLLIISLILYAGFLVLIFSQAFGQENEVVPLVQLRQPYHIILFTVIWPIVGSLLALFVFPRIFVPLFLKFKTKVTHRMYKDCKIKLQRPINLKLLLSRSFSVFLLVMGLEGAILPLLDLSLFYMPSQSDYPTQFLPYNPQAFIVTAGIIFPFALVLWIMVWAIQDSGLVHYQLAEDLAKYQEIEPVYYKVNGYIKGFAGVSSLFFYFTAIYIIAQDAASEWLNIVWIVGIALILIIWSCPIILIYTRMNFNWVAKDVKEMTRIHIQDLNLI